MLFFTPTPLCCPAHPPEGTLHESVMSSRVVDAWDDDWESVSGCLTVASSTCCRCDLTWDAMRWIADAARRTTSLEDRQSRRQAP